MGPFFFRGEGRRNKKRRSLGRRPKHFFFIFIPGLSFSLFLSLSSSPCLSLPIAISHRFRGRNKFINKRAGDPRQLQGAPAEIERLENNPPSETRRGAARRRNRFPIFFVQLLMISLVLSLSRPLFDYIMT